MTRLDEMIGGETGFGGGWRRRNKENGTTRADKFINFFSFSFAQCIFSFYNSCFSYLLMFSSLLLCKIVSGLRGGGGYVANA